eukprot:6105368-Prymnesium_polylepis.1
MWPVEGESAELQAPPRRSHRSPRGSAACRKAAAVKTAGSRLSARAPLREANLEPTRLRDVSQIPKMSIAPSLLLDSGHLSRRWPDVCRPRRVHLMRAARRPPLRGGRSGASLAAWAPPQSSPRPHTPPPP